MTDLGEFRNGPKVINVLNGSYIPTPSNSLATKDLLDECRCTDKNINMANHDNITTKYKKTGEVMDNTEAKILFLLSTYWTFQSYFSK